MHSDDEDGETEVGLLGSSSSSHGDRVPSAADRRGEERREREADGLCTDVLVRVDRKQIPVFFTFPFIYWIYCPTTTRHVGRDFCNRRRKCVFFFSLTFFTTQKRADARLSLTGDFIYSRQIIRD
jgi:hypothetical protein